MLISAWSFLQKIVLIKVWMEVSTIKKFVFLWDVQVSVISTESPYVQTEV
jgi:hypothetical protein